MSKSIDTKIEYPVDRRGALKLFGFGAAAATAGVLMPSDADATPESAKKLIEKLSGTASHKSGKVTLKMPDIAENGATVPLTVHVDSPMTEKDYVKFIHLASEKNPKAEVASFHLSPSSGRAEVSTRMRLSKTQNVIAVAVMNDGSVFRTARQVKVTIGGCGG